jgi:hypothetical protein
VNAKTSCTDRGLKMKWPQLPRQSDLGGSSCYVLVFGVDLAGDRLPTRRRRSRLVDQHRDGGPNQPVGDRAAGRLNRMQDSLSTFPVVGLEPTSSRSDGSSPRSPRSAASRSAGTAQTSERIAALTSSHHAVARTLSSDRPRTTGRRRARAAPARRRWRSRPGSQDPLGLLVRGRQKSGRNR